MFFLKRFLYSFVLVGFVCAETEPVKVEVPQAVQAPASAYNYWQKTAILSFVEIEKKLKKYHAGSMDKESNAFRDWLVQGKKEFYDRFKQISTQDGWYFALKAYISGFNDIHVRINLHRDDKNEWPGFLVQFTGKRFVVVESALRLVPNGSTVTKIDDIDVKEWIDKNVVPYGDNIQETSARYSSAAVMALWWQQNPFVVKPKTISIQQKYGPVGPEIKIKLAWKSIASKTFYKKYIRIQGYSPFKDRINPLRIKDVTSSVAWIKIPTFEPQGQWARFMFNRDLQKLASKVGKRVLVIDLRGNRGGLVGYASKFLAYLYGMQAVVDAEKACRSSIGLNITKRVADDLNVRHKGADSADAATLDWVFDVVKEGGEILVDDSEASLVPRVISREMQKEIVASGAPFITKQGLVKMPKEPTKARVYVVVDADVASTSLFLIDMLKHLAGNSVKLIGQPTLADTTYVGVKVFRIRRGNLVIPTIVHRGRPRGYNQPYLPDYSLSARRMKDDAWLQGKVLDIINSKRL
jgi:hypothetical protein